MEPQASWETTSSANKWRHSVVYLARSLLFLLGSCDASKWMGETVPGVPVAAKMRNRAVRVPERARPGENRLGKRWGEPEKPEAGFRSKKSHAAGR